MERMIKHEWKERSSEWFREDWIDGPQRHAFTTRLKCLSIHSDKEDSRQYVKGAHQPPPWRDWSNPLHGSAGLKPFCDLKVHVHHLREESVAEIQWLSLLEFWKPKRFKSQVSSSWAATSTRCLERAKRDFFDSLGMGSAWTRNIVKQNACSPILWCVNLCVAYILVCVCLRKRDSIELDIP